MKEGIRVCCTTTKYNAVQNIHEVDKIEEGTVIQFILHPSERHSSCFDPSELKALVLLDSGVFQEFSLHNINANAVRAKHAN